MNTSVYPATLTLADGPDDGADRVVVRPAEPSASDGIACTEWDLGAPEVRYTAVPRPGADGTDQGAGFLGSRTVSLRLRIRGGLDRTTDPVKTVRDAYWFHDKLVSMCHPQRSPELRIHRAGGPTAGQTWTLALRGNPWSIVYGRQAAGFLDLQLTFTAPEGLLEGPLSPPYYTALASGEEQTEWKFPALFPKTFGAGTANHPSVTLNVGGSSPIGPRIYINGPVTNPEVRTDDGERFRFDNLTLVTGQTVEINMETGVIRLGNTTTQVVSDDPSVYQAVDFGVSTFWRWDPGVHVVRYLARSGSVAVQYRERRMNV
jgi:hypothetical protein